MKKGLTSEKCVHLLLDGGWTQIGVPTTIMSDQGLQFCGTIVSNYVWEVRHSRGILQAYHPQANGRVEVPGQHLIGLLRKLNAEEEINWVEALPRSLLYLRYRVREDGLYT